MCEEPGHALSGEPFIYDGKTGDWKRDEGWSLKSLVTLWDSIDMKMLVKNKLLSPFTHTHAFPNPKNIKGHNLENVLYTYMYI